MFTATGFIVMCVAASLDVHGERGRIAAQALRADAEHVHRRATAASRASRPRIGAARAERPRRRDLGEMHAQVGGAADADADDRRRAGLAAGVEHAVDDEGLDRVDAVGGDRHLEPRVVLRAAALGDHLDRERRRARRRNRCGSPARRRRTTCARSCASSGARPTSAADARASRARSPRRIASFSADAVDFDAAADRHVVDRDAGVLAQQVVGAPRRPRCSGSSCRARACAVASVSRAASASKPRLTSGGSMLQRADVELLRGFLDRRPGRCAGRCASLPSVAG